MTQRPTGPNIFYRSSDNPGPPQRPRIKRNTYALGPQIMLFFGIILFLIIAYQVAIWMWNSTAPKEVTIPRVVGLREAEANMVLSTKGLKPEIIAKKYNEEVAEGVVISIDPAADRQVKAGRVVRMVVSLGSRWTKVPDVKQMSVDRAHALIREAKLNVGKESAALHPKIPIGYVINQNPPAGTKVTRDSSVNLLLSRGAETPVETPGQPKPPAEERRSYTVDFTVPPGPSLQEVRIVVYDAKGEHEVYRRNHQVGDIVHKEVIGEGSEAVVQIYVSGFLAEEHPF